MDQRGKIRSRVLEILREVLHDQGLGADDDFFEAGGDSLRAITLMLRLEREFGGELSAHSGVEGEPIRHAGLRLFWKIHHYFQQNIQQAL